MVSKEDIINKVYEGKLYSCPGDNEIRQAMDEYYNEAVDNCIEVVKGKEDLEYPSALLCDVIINALEQLKKPLQ